MSGLKLLVFPLDMDGSGGFISYAKALDAEVFGASSVMSEAAAKKLDIDVFCRLPFITELSFESSFLKLITLHGITHVFTPHGAIWTHLAQQQKKNKAAYNFKLCEPSPYEAEWLRLDPSYKWADTILGENFVECLELPETIAARGNLKKGQYASLHRQFVGISGQCDDQKLLALAHIMRVVPQGDLVEIGSFQGRSAFAIGWLAHQYAIGSLVSVDPWDNAKVVDQGGQAEIVNSELKQGRDLVDFDKIFWSYIGAISLLNNAGYIKDTSEMAVRVYKDACKTGELPDNELNAIPLAGQISMLHIDGNHRYDFVCKDIELWSPLVMPGGWILLDDYVWAFGDGPQKAGDELLATGHYDVAFTMSDTLFLRRCG